MFQKWHQVAALHLSQNANYLFAIRTKSLFQVFFFSFWSLNLACRLWHVMGRGCTVSSKSPVHCLVRVVLFFILAQYVNIKFEFNKQKNIFKSPFIFPFYCSVQKHYLIINTLVSLTHGHWVVLYLYFCIIVSLNGL